jgi:hypothetical protein
MSPSDADAADAADSPTPPEAGDGSQEGGSTQSKLHVSKQTKSAPKLFDPADKPEMPEVQQGALDAARAKIQATKAASVPAGVKDTEGRPFDPAWHLVGPDGGPVMNRDGTCRKIGGRGGPKATGKPGSGSAAPHASFINSGPATPPPPNPQVELDAKIDATARVSADLTFNMAVMFGGEDFKPDAGEPEAMVSAYKGVYVKYGVTDLPPLAVLGIVLFGYASKRWNAPKVKERRQSLKETIWKWWNRKKIAAEEKRLANFRHRDTVNKSPEQVADAFNMAAPAAH